MTNHQWPFTENTLFECCYCEHQCTQADKKPLITKDHTVYACPKCNKTEFYYVNKEDAKL